MTNFGTMQDRIADELDRSDLTTQIQAAIQSAIAFYQDERFFFNEGVTNIVTATASEAYAVSSILDIDYVVVNVNGHPADMTPRPFDYIDSIRDPSYTGIPHQYGIFADQMYVYPVPNDVYTIEVAGCIALGTLTATADTNAWMTSGEELIRRRAKADLCNDILKDYEEADRQTQLELRALERLKARTFSKVRSGGIIPTEF